MKICKYHPFIDEYMNGCRSGDIVVEDDILLALDYIEKKLNKPGIFIDAEKVDKAKELIEKYFEVEWYDWELFVLALVHAYYSNDTLVFDEFDIVMGRGNGKNGFISGLVWYLTTHYHGVAGYNVDIVANSEDQAMTSFNDIYEMLEVKWKKLKNFFTKTKEEIINKKTKSYIKYNTSNSRTKDGKRTACLVVDEFHEYENYNTINVFKSGFGKKKHSRIFKISTNGHVREGVFDEEMRLYEDILNGTITQTGIVPLIYRLKKESDVQDKNNWHKANPSLKYKPELMKIMEKEFIEMQYKPSVKTEFMTKRMNFPMSDSEIAVTEWKNIAATNKELPELKGWSCSVGIDFTLITDWAAVNFHFKKGKERYDINKAFMCSSSKDIPRLKIPWKEWAMEGKIEYIDDVEIHPEIICAYIEEMGKKYNITGIWMDNFRYSLLSAELEKIGFDAHKKKNVHMVRGTDLTKVVPLIDSCFVNQYFSWGDNPALRWATNNTKLIRLGRSYGRSKGGNDKDDIGNYTYGKIEGKARKTDPFQALAFSMVGEVETKEKLKPGSIGTLVF